MALPSSGALSFSAIATEFGGSAPHSMSEYYPLVGLGVTGLPSSGTFNFSHFHGKSNQVTVSVWVSSGYNSSSWNFLAAYYNVANGNYIYFTNHPSVGSRLTLDPFGLGNRSGTSFISGNYKYTQGGYRQSYYYAVNRYQLVTTWIDTSGYQNQTTTVSI